MKQFLKYTLATIVGTLIVAVSLCIISVVAIVGMAASEQLSTEVKGNSILALNLSGMLAERSEGGMVSTILGEDSAPGLNDILEAIDKAKTNDKVKGIYIEAGAFVSDSPASSQAIRKKLEDFKKSGKWIVAYGDQFTQTTYYICSVADKVYINPIGMLDWHGLSAQPMFYKDLLAKFGVKVQLTKVGKYKSAPETYTADKMSDANREQVSVYMNNIWQSMVNDVAQSRKISAEKLNLLADEYQAFKDPTELKKSGLVDGLLYSDQIKSEIKKKLSLGKDDSINQLTVSDMINTPSDTKGDEIAVYYAFGSIVDSAPSGVGATDSYIVGDKVSKDLQDLADDDDVKAVVVRVNSGGGSAYASEQIWHAMTLLKAKKPVVVSMGGMAASGGYYMSCPANYIFAETTTITGSIGIFGMIPDFSGLLTDKLGVKFDEINTNKHSGMGTLARPFNEEEMAMLNAYVGRGYELFRKRVADGRHLSVNSVEQIAQGRVWTGGDALKIKLIDEIGGIDKAIDKAAKLAKVGEYHSKGYPVEADWMTQLLGSVSGGSDNYLDDQLRATLGEYYAPFVYMKTINRQSAIQARLPYELVIK